MSSRSCLFLLLSAAIVLFSGVSTAQSDFDGVEITATPISDGIYMLKGAGGNMGLCIGEDGAFLIDDQFAPLTDKILAAIAVETDKKVEFVFNTHYHGDHTGGNESLGAKGSHLVGHANIRRRMSHEQYSDMLKRSVDPSPAGALPVITFSDSLTFHYNDQDIVAFHVPNAHTDGDGVVHFPKANIIHTGDVVFVGLYPFIDTYAGGSVDGMIAGVEQIIAMCDDETVVIPGHGPLIKKKEVEEYLVFLNKARDLVSAAMAENEGLEAVQAAKPCAEWDDTLGAVWLNSDQFVQSIYDSLNKN
ncbi:MAG: cyclase [Candidatus Krumholzibacteriia bacterium]|jgi:cyclase